MITDIVVGHWNEIFKREEELSEYRLSICRQCPLYKATEVGRVCDPDLYLNPNTGDTSYKYKEGYTRGCNCRLDAKSRVPGALCPTGKWKR